MIVPWLAGDLWEVTENEVEATGSDLEQRGGNLCLSEGAMVSEASYVD
jgi:hypothetical protein